MVCLRLYANGLLGNIESNVTARFMGSDSETNYIKNLQIKPKDWYYRNCKITYRYNTNGHRCHEIDEVDFDNYILFVGDSHAEGVGLELKRTFAYLTAQKLGVSYYNLGLAGTGLDYMLFNVISWISRYPRPRYIFNYWTDPTRFLKITEGNKILQAWMINHAMPEADKHFLVYGEMAGYVNTKHWLTSTLLKTVLDNNNIPFFNFYCGHPDLHYKSQFIERLLPDFAYDRARDDHYGNETHIAISEILCEKFNGIYNTNSRL